MTGNKAIQIQENKLCSSHLSSVVMKLHLSNFVIYPQLSCSNLRCCSASCMYLLQVWCSPFPPKSSVPSEQRSKLRTTDQLSLLCHTGEKLQFLHVLRPGAHSPRMLYPPQFCVALSSIPIGQMTFCTHRTLVQLLFFSLVCLFFCFDCFNAHVPSFFMAS